MVDIFPGLAVTISEVGTPRSVRTGAVNEEGSSVAVLIAHIGLVGIADERTIDTEVLDPHEAIVSRDRVWAIEFTGIVLVSCP